MSEAIADPVVVTTGTAPGEHRYAFGIMINGTPNGEAVPAPFPAKPERRTPRFFPVYAYDGKTGEHYYIESFIDGSFEFSHAHDVVLREAARLLAASGMHS